jgi:hypothetical protein
MYKLAETFVQTDTRKNIGGKVDRGIVVSKRHRKKNCTVGRGQRGRER